MTILSKIESVTSPSSDDDTDSPTELQTIKVMTTTIIKCLVASLAVGRLKLFQYFCCLANFLSITFDFTIFFNQAFESHIFYSLAALRGNVQPHMHTYIVLYVLAI